MEPTTWIIPVVLVVLTVTFYLSWTSRDRVLLPPGPRDVVSLIRIIVSLLYTRVDIMLTELAREWGDIFSLDVFGKRLIFLNSLDIAHELLGSKKYANIFAGRPRGIAVWKYSEHSTIFLQPSTALSKHKTLVRKVTNKTKMTFDSELRFAVEWLEQNGDQRINFDKTIQSSVINFMAILLLGKRHEYESMEMNNLICLIDLTSIVFSPRSVTLSVVFPFLKYIPIGLGRHLKEYNSALDQVLKEYYLTSKDTCDPNVSRGMIDDLIRQQREMTTNSESTWFSDDSIKAKLIETIFAGTLTMRNIISTFFLIILHKPEVARRIQCEIEASISTGRCPTLKDRENMPYTVAAIFELLRFHTSVSLPFPRSTTKDIKFRGYLIPENTIAVLNVWAIHHEDTLWVEPWEFRPERFLGEDGKILPAEHRNRRNLRTFSLGRRACPGEVFAKDRIFEFITTMLQHFNFFPDKRISVPSADPRLFKQVGINLVPPIFYLCAKARCPSPA